MPAVPVILPPRLDDLLVRIQVAQTYPVPTLGTARACLDDNHPVKPWIDGVYANRQIRLLRCAACTAVEVRDVSFDANIGGSRLARRRLYALLGRYYGKRERGREYLGSLGSRRA